MRIEDQLDKCAREDCPRILSLLAARFGNLDLADDAVQEALIQAAAVWPEQGVPTNPGGWIMTVARRKAIDELRRRGREERRLRRDAPALVEAGEPADLLDEPLIRDDAWPAGRQDIEADPTGGDERLRLVLLCCHPALDQKTQVALTLRLVGGLTTKQISAAFLVPEATLAQRIVRAKRKISTARIPMTIPSHLGERLDAVLSVLYLIFNEGYLAHSEAGEVVAVDLVEEAVRLTRLVARLAPESAEAGGLLCLELYHRARHAARVDELGELVLLEDQDRSLWDRAQIAEANALMTELLKRLDPGPFQVQAIIAGSHANAASAAETNWEQVAALYSQLASMLPTPVVALNQAVAVAMARGPEAGLNMIDGLEGLENYHLFWACRGELRHRSGDNEGAVADLERAHALATGAAEQRHLSRRLDVLRSG